MDDIDFSYDGNDEEAKRIASEPKKPKPVKAVARKKIELKPIELPQQALETAVDVTAVVPPPDHQPALIHEEHTQTTAQVAVKMPQKSENVSEISAPLLAIAAVTAAASVSLAASALKGKTKLKRKNKTKSNNNRRDNRNEEEKKKEEQKACNSKSDKVQQLIDDVNTLINNNFVEQVNVEKDSKFTNRITALNLEIVALNKRLKKLEDKKKTTYTKRR